MKAVILHGPAISSSRGKLIDIKKKFDPSSVVTFEEGASTADILTSLQSVAMFGEERLIIAENASEDLAHCTLYPVPCTLILWFDHEIDPKKYLASRSGPQAEVLFFPEGKEITVFPLLDLLASRNKMAFIELDKLKKSSLPAGRQGLDTQYIITMIFYLLRSLIYLPKTAHPFVQKKVGKQRANFTEEDVISLYKFILETDFKIKKGLLETSHAEFLLINKFVSTQF